MPMPPLTGAAAIALALTLAAPLAAHAADAMRVVMDPKSGELRPPTAAEAAAFAKAEAQLRAARAGSSGKAQNTPPAGTEIRHADGTIETILGEDTHLYSVVSADANGNLNYDCLPAQQAHKFVKGATRKSTAPAKAATAKAGHVHQ
jgi:hypothetical protein